MRVGIYARVSTHDQQTLPMQLKQMKEYVKHRKWKACVEFQEVGSGAKSRPKREELLKMARRREIDAILVWKLDRFGRSLPDLVTTLSELRELGVVFVSLTESPTSLLHPDELWPVCFPHSPSLSEILFVSG